MPAIRLRRAPLPLALALSGCGESAPPPPVIEPRPTGRHDRDRVRRDPHAAWLGGDRWAVVAPLDVTVALADFTDPPLDSSRPDPAKIKNPAQVFVAGDTLYVGDWGLRRTSLWSLDGRLCRSLPAADVARGALPRGRDGAGRFYLGARAAGRARTAQGNRDSAAVVVAVTGIATGSTPSPGSPRSTSPR